MYANAGLLIGAGSETTATLLSGTTFLLLQNPSAMHKLTQEIRSAFTSDADINLARVCQLPYLGAVMEEGMRLYPPGPAANVRVTNIPTRIDGHVVPAGVRVAVQQWTTHRSASNFYDPECFRPERWLHHSSRSEKTTPSGVGEQDLSIFANDRRDAVQPFSYGPRNCLGKSLAYAEMYTAMARTFFNFDMRLCAESQEWMDTQNAFIFWNKGPLWVEITPRAT